MVGNGVKGIMFDMDNTLLRSNIDFEVMKQVWYQPLTKVAHAMPVYALAHDYKGQGLGTTWSSPDKRSSFIGNFAVPSE